MFQGHHLRLLSWLKISLIILSLSLLSGCKFYKDSAAWKKPLPRHLVAAIKDRGFELGAPILARLYKKENRFEIWMKKKGRFYFFRSYGICSWSGKLGPKLKTGDNQAPEGYYVVTPAQMNPRSKFHLSFNLGYPNFYDRAHGRTGAHLMVHGECSSRGCYALTNSSIEEVYLLARDSFKNGQRRFHVHAYPFKMTKYNLDRYKDNKWIDFWKNLAEGDALFKKTGLPMKMVVANKRYVFAPSDVPIFAPAIEKPKIIYANETVKAKQLPEYIAEDVKLKPSTLKQKAKSSLSNLNNEAANQPIVVNEKIQELEHKANSGSSSLYNGVTPTNKPLVPSE